MDLSHFRTGSGPPLLLLHRLGMGKHVWRPVVPLLAREREVIALDLPGFGASPQGPHTVEGLAHCVAAFAAGLGLERPHVAGNSLGGGVALAMGEAGTVGSVCALSPVGFASGREGTYARAVLAATRGISRVLLPVAATLARSARHAHAAVLARGRETVADPARGRRRVGPQLREGARPSGTCSTRPTATARPTPACPTTIAWGDRDRLLIFSRQAPRARAHAPGRAARRRCAAAATCRCGTTPSRSRG